MRTFAYYVGMNDRLQPAVMQLIERRRDRLNLSFAKAGVLGGISASRWKQLEDGGRTMHGTWVKEVAPDHTLARMAFAVHVTAAELRSHGHADAAEILGDLLAAAAAKAAERQRNAAAAAAAVDGISDSERADLAAMIAEDLRALE